MSANETTAAKLRKTILGADDIEAVPYEVPEWGVTLELRTPNADERMTMTSMFSGGDEVDMTKMFPALIVSCAYDPASGERVFTADDLALLGQKNGAVVQRVGQRCMEVAGMTEAAVDAGKDDFSTTLSVGTRSS